MAKNTKVKRAPQAKAKSTAKPAENAPAQPRSEVPVKPQPAEEATEKQPQTKRRKAAGQRDPRLPEAGTVLTGRHKGKEHSCKVLEKGFEYRGKPYRSLSAIAREITGSSWNGFAFFGCIAKEQA